MDWKLLSHRGVVPPRRQVGGAAAWAKAAGAVGTVVASALPRGLPLGPLHTLGHYALRPRVVSPAVSSWQAAPYRDVTNSIRLCRSSALNCLKRSRLAAP